MVPTFQTWPRTRWIWSTFRKAFNEHNTWNVECVQAAIEIGDWHFKNEIIIWGFQRLSEKWPAFSCLFHICKTEHHPMHHYNWDLTPSDFKVLLNFKLLSKGKRSRTRLRRQLLSIPKYDFQVILNSGRDAEMLKGNFWKQNKKHVYARGHRSWKIFLGKLSMNFLLQSLRYFLCIVQKRT